jgi:lipoate-protein ligase A
MAEWRLLRDGITDAYHHFAVEEALARLLDEGHSPPTLRLRQVRRAVFVGVFQDTWAEVDVGYCRAHGIQIVRRMNGGGAVYHDVGSFCYSAFFPRATFPQGEAELYRLFAEPAIRTCAEYGINAHFAGRNDLLTGGRKIYGSAHFAWYGAFVQSGTFLVNMDFGVMERALTPPPLKFAGKSAHSIQGRVTSLSQEVGRELDTDEVMDRFAAHSARALGIRLIPGDLTPKERVLADELLDVKYSTDEWNLGSRPAFQITVADRTAEGVVSLSADVDGATLRQTRIRGDLLLGDQRVLDDLERSLSGCAVQDAQAAAQAASLPISVREILVRLLAKLGEEVTAASLKASKEDER